jgi:hypothetical protein
MNEKAKLVNAEQLLRKLFEPACRPSLRWLRTQTKENTIPHVRIGHLVFFDIEQVRESFDGNATRKASVDSAQQRVETAN